MGFRLFGYAVVLVMVSLMLPSCSQEETAPNSFEEQGQLKIYLIDNPAVFDAVNIVVTRVEAHLSGADSTSGWVVLSDSTATYDLLVLRNGVSAVLADSVLPAGNYTQLRLIVGDGSTVVVDGMTHPLEIPSGTQTGVKLNHPFSIPAGGIVELTLDFDADRSVIQTGSGDYQLQPVIRVQATTASGSISGVALPLDAQISVYTTVGSDTVSASPDSGTGFFKLMALPEGTYTVSFRPANPAYEEMAVSGVEVLPGQDTGLGVVLIGSFQISVGKTQR